MKYIPVTPVETKYIATIFPTPAPTSELAPTTLWILLLLPRPLMMMDVRILAVIKEKTQLAKKLINAR
jgi:hypothetical protein